MVPFVVPIASAVVTGAVDVGGDVGSKAVAGISAAIASRFKKANVIKIALLEMGSHLAQVGQAADAVREGCRFKKSRLGCCL